MNAPAIIHVVKCCLVITAAVHKKMLFAVVMASIAVQIASVVMCLVLVPSKPQLESLLRMSFVLMVVNVLIVIHAVRYLLVDMVVVLKKMLNVVVMVSTVVLVGTHVT